MTDPSLAVSIPAFIDQTLEVYNIQLQLNSEVAEVDRGILEILAPGGPLSNHAHTNMTNDNFRIKYQTIYVYHSRDSSCTERSKSYVDDIIDELQNVTPISEAINYSSADPSSFQVTTTQRGGKCLMEGNFVYTRHRTINNKVHWQCIQRVFC